MNRFFLTLIGWLLFYGIAVAQELHIGDQLPDLSFSIYNYGRTNVRVSDYNGKVLVLDFWKTGCIPCVESFPEITALNAKYADKLFVLPVTFQDIDPVKALITRVSKGRPEFNVPSVTNERKLYSYFDITATPTYVVIGPDGKIKAIENSLTEEKIKALLQAQ